MMREEDVREIASVADAGLGVEGALLAATRNGAELLGIGDRHGRIAPGYVFDAIVLDEDPSDLAFARTGQVGGVFKAGQAVVPHPRLQPEVSLSLAGRVAEGVATW